MKTRLSFKALTCFQMLFSAQVLFAAEYIITYSVFTTDYYSIFYR